MESCRLKGCQEPIQAQRATYSLYCSEDHAMRDDAYQERNGFRSGHPDAEYLRGIQVRTRAQYGGEEELAGYNKTAKAIDQVCRMVDTKGNSLGYYTTATTISGRLAQITDTLVDDDNDYSAEALRVLRHAVLKDSQRADRKYRPRITLASYINRHGGNR